MRHKVIYLEGNLAVEWFAEGTNKPHLFRATLNSSGATLKLTPPLIKYSGFVLNESGYDASMIHCDLQSIMGKA